MGWIRRIVHRMARPDPSRHPWISPQFLALFAALGLLVVSLGVWANWNSSGGHDAAGGTGPMDEAPSEREYVGFPTQTALVTALATAGPDCDAACLVDQEWQAWLADHPAAHVLEKTPVAENGIVIGFWVSWTG